MVKDLFKSTLNKFPTEQQRALIATIKNVESLYPFSERSIALGMPTLKIGEDNLCHVMGLKKHNSFFLSSGAITNLLKNELSDYEVSKGTIQFPLDEPFPKSLM